jgi:hypothetical protein
LFLFSSPCCFFFSFFLGLFSISLHFLSPPPFFFLHSTSGISGSVNSSSGFARSNNRFNPMQRQYNANSTNYNSMGFSPQLTSFSSQQQTATTSSQVCCCSSSPHLLINGNLVSPFCSNNKLLWVFVSLFIIYLRTAMSRLSMLFSATMVQ